MFYIYLTKQYRIYIYIYIYFYFIFLLTSLQPPLTFSLENKDPVLICAFVLCAKNEWMCKGLKKKKERESNSERSLRGPNILSQNIWLDTATLPLFFSHTHNPQGEKAALSFF